MINFMYEMNLKAKALFVLIRKTPKDIRPAFGLLCTDACVRSMGPVCTSCV